MSGTPAKLVPELVFIPPLLHGTGKRSTPITPVGILKPQNQSATFQRSTAVKRVPDAGSGLPPKFGAECFNCYRSVTRYPYEYAVEWALHHQCKPKGGK